MNLQNLPRNLSKSKLRSALLAPPGHKLIVADLAQIEARIVAEFCGQDALVESFKQGEDVYSSFASIIFGTPVNKKDQPNERFIGKTAILGLGYGCGHVRFHQMVTTQAKQANISLVGLFDERVAEFTTNTYRSLFSKIPDMWRRLDRCLAVYINGGHQEFVDVGPVAFGTGTIKLPNGLTLRYELHDDKLYGAKLLENVVQALARNILMSASVRLAKRGLRFVLQAHDELAFVVSDDDVEVAKNIISEEMIRPPEWMVNLPLAVEIGVGQNYGECK